MKTECLQTKWKKGGKKKPRGQKEKEMALIKEHMKLRLLKVGPEGLKVWAYNNHRLGEVTVDCRTRATIIKLDIRQVKIFTDHSPLKKTRNMH